MSFTRLLCAAAALAAFAGLWERIRKNPAAEGLFLSRDGRVSAFYIPVNQGADRRDIGRLQALPAVAIRLEQGNLTVSQSWFTDSQQGILTGNDANGRIVMSIGVLVLMPPTSMW